MITAGAVIALAATAEGAITAELAESATVDMQAVAPNRAAEAVLT
jgi:hypothetical protein